MRAAQALPLVALTLAGAAVAFLVAGELAGPSSGLDFPEPELAGQDPGAAPTAALLAEPAPQSAAAQPAPAPSPGRRPIGSRPRPQPQRPLRPAATGRVQETQLALDASPWLNQLLREQDLIARLGRLEALVQRASPEGAAEALAGLLDCELPGDFYEGEQLRLSILSQLGKIPGRRAEELLLARLDQEQPRPQRLAALDLLAARGAAEHHLVQGLAEADPDTRVRDKARWALARARQARERQETP